MTHNRIVTSAVLIAGVCGFSASPTQAADDDKAAVGQAVDGFYSALNALFTGEIASMEEVWSHADDVTYMGPIGGHQSGWKAVQANWQLQADKKLGGEIKNESVRIFVGDRIAVAQGVEKGFNFVDGKRQDVSIRSSSVFRKEHGKWKMISHHTDLLPFLRD